MGLKLDSITMNLPKNAIQYLIGFGLYILVFGSFDPIKLFFGLTSFLICYAAIYPYNDLMDYETDKKDKWKQRYKALVRGDLSHQRAITLVFGLPIIGLMLASFVSTHYMLLLIFLLFLNFLYSSPLTRLKKQMKTAIPLMYLMQVTKFSLGWFTFTTNITTLPGWIINTLSMAYLVSYVLYKNNLLNMKKTFKTKKNLMIPLCTMTITSYVISFLIYPYKIPIILLIPLTLLIFLFRKNKNMISKTLKLANFSTVLMGLIALLLLLLNVPVIDAINENTSEAFDRLGELTVNQMDNDSYEFICKINETIYSQPIKDLNELNQIINITGMEIVVRDKE